MNDTNLEALLQNLPQAAEQGLSGLTATDALKTRIQLAAAQQKKPRSRFSMQLFARWASVACCCAVLALVIGFALPRPAAQPAQPDGLITSGTLGDGATEAPPVMGDLGQSGVYIQAGNANPDYRSMWAPATGGSFPLIGVDGKYYRLLTTPRNVDGSLRGSALGTVSEFTTEPSLAGTDTVLSNVVAFGETVYAVRGMEDTLVIAKVDGHYRSMWAPATGGSFPLIGVDGKYYRLLTTPRNVDGSLRGSALGTVSEFTTEPSLAGTDTVLSNVVAFGETVYAVRGMEDTLVIAKVDGQMRLFQRVSFNGNARRGRETLEDTLQVGGRVIGMELTGVGTITDPAVCNQLMNSLFDNASYESSGSISSRQSLIIELDNGLVVQLAVKNDSLAACGVWSCPEFFEEFEAACD